MSRSFRESYLGRPHQAIRGFYWGRKKKSARSVRYRLANMRDEENEPDVPRLVNGRWLDGLSRHRWQKPDLDFEIIRRNGRKFMRYRRNRGTL